MVRRLQDPYGAMPTTFEEVGDDQFISKPKKVSKKSTKNDKVPLMVKRIMDYNPEVEDRRRTEKERDVSSNEKADENRTPLMLKRITDYWNTLVQKDS